MSRYVAFLLLASLCFGYQKKGKPPKGPEVVMLEVACRRIEGDVQVDGRLRVAAEKPVRNLQLLIDFLGSDKQLLQTKHGEVDSGELDPGEETEFHMRVADPIRAVSFALRVEDGDGKELRLEKPGPYPIE